MVAIAPGAPVSPATFDEARPPAAGEPGETAGGIGACTEPSGVGPAALPSLPISKTASSPIYLLRASNVKERSWGWGAKGGLPTKGAPRSLTPTNASFIQITLSTLSGVGSL